MKSYSTLFSPVKGVAGAAALPPAADVPRTQTEHAIEAQTRLRSPVWTSDIRGEHPILLTIDRSPLGDGSDDRELLNHDELIMSGSCDAIVYVHARSACVHLFEFTSSDARGGVSGGAAYVAGGTTSFRTASTTGSPEAAQSRGTPPAMMGAGGAVSPFLTRQLSSTVYEVVAPSSFADQLRRILVTLRPFCVDVVSAVGQLHGFLLTEVETFFAAVSHGELVLDHPVTQHRLATILGVSSSSTAAMSGSTRATMGTAATRVSQADVAAARASGVGPVGGFKNVANCNDALARLLLAPP